MKQKKIKNYKTVIHCSAIIIIALLFFNSCNKEKKIVKEGNNASPQMALRTLQADNYIAIDNPYKMENVRATIERYKNMQTEFNNYILDENRIDVYVKIKAIDIPSNRTEELMHSLHLFNYPLDAEILYSQDLTDENIETIEGEYLYTFLPKNSSLLNELPFVKIYEVYKPTQEENWLEEAILYDGEMLEDEDRNNIAQDINNYSTNSSSKIFGKIKPKQPKGIITYNNTPLGSTPVPFVEVLARKGNDFVSTFTDAQGNYQINSNFFAGTWIHCHFVNNNISIVPINISSGTTIGQGFNFLARILKGPKSVGQWFWKNSLPSASIGFNNVKKQTNFWSHILHMDHLHRQSNNAEGILSAPTGLRFWAILEDKDENSAGTLMIKHLALNLGITSQLTTINNNVGLQSIGVSTWNGLNPIVQSAILSLGPDMKVTSGKQYIDKHFTNTPNFVNYSVDISKTILHEMSHAGMYSKVGDLYWLNLGIQEMDRESGGNYGWGNIYTNGTWNGASTGLTSVANAIPGNIPNTLDDFIELSEAWAEFLGERYIYKFYSQAGFPSAKCRMCDPLGGGPNGSNNVNLQGDVGKTNYQFASLAFKKESGHAWADEWIPCGMFQDLIDVNNTDATENLWDFYGGYTVQELFNAFNINRPAHNEYLEYIAPMHGYNLGQLFFLYKNNLKI